jgi:hypothetical protein
MVFPHYSYVYNGNTIHATSNIPLKLDSSQNVDSPMPSLILEKSKNPGSIITAGAHKIISLNKTKIVP